MDRNDNLPDVSQWQPNSSSKENLGNGLLLTCQAAQSRIVAEAKIERRFNINNFDSGSGVEDIVRQEISKLLPGRYFVDSGVINDHKGRTAGDCDVVVRNGIWCPVVKLGATPESRRRHFPIESVYAVSEIKQTLGLPQLDAAMEKLVKVSRLMREDNPYGHITENQHIRNFDRESYILNPLHTAIISTDLQRGTVFHDIVSRFGKINALLDRKEMVTLLCVLGHGAAWYKVKGGNSINATFMWDRDKYLQLNICEQERENTFYRFFIHLAGHLHRSVLWTVNIEDKYGGGYPECRIEDYEDAAYNPKLS